MEQPTQTVFARLHVWGFTVSCAVAAAVLSVLALPLHMWKHEHFAGYGMGQGGPGPYGPEGHAMGLWPVWMLLLVTLWAGIAGAIVAAVYNAMVARR